MSRSLLADVVVTCVQQSVQVHAPGQVDIDDSGRVIHAGKRTATKGDTVENLGGLLMPGLVNAHGHGPMVLLRGVGDGLPLSRWLTEAIWPREARLETGDVEWGMKLATAEMLLAGVTTSCDMYFDDAAMIEAVLAVGGRHLCTPAVVGAVHNQTPADLSKRIDEIKQLHSRYHQAQDRIGVGIGPHSPYDLPLDVVGQLADLASELDAVLHMHVAETHDEGAELERAEGCSTVQAIDRAGVLRGNVLTAHSVWISPDDISTYAARGTHVAHCPTSNMKLGSGIAPIAEMLAAGVNVALGTDGAASNDDLDLWDEMALAPLLARVRSHDPGAMTASDSLLMATANGGRALRMDIGTLAAGSWADIVRIDLDRPSWHPLTDLSKQPDQVVSRLVFATKSRDVTDVWVGGRRVVDGGELTTIDVSQAAAEVDRRGKRLAGDL